MTEVDSFLAAYDRYGVGKLTDAERDRYVAEMAQVGEMLGAEDLPHNRRELAESLASFRPECHFGPQARDAVRFLLAPPVPFVLRGAYGVIGAASIALLPPWARRKMRLPLLPGVDPMAIRPAATVLTRTIGWLLGELDASDRSHRPLSA